MLRPGEIELTVRNAGPDPVTVAQVFVNDAYVNFTPSGGEIGRLGAEKLTLDYPWQEGSPLLGLVLTSTGATVEHTSSRGRDPGGRRQLLRADGAARHLRRGHPGALGMLFLPFLGRVRESWIRIFMAATIGLLGFLAVDAYLEGTEIAAASTGAPSAGSSSCSSGRPFLLRARRPRPPPARAP